VLETGKEKDWKRVLVCSQDSAQSGTPDCPVVHRTVSGAPGWSSANWPLSGKVRRRTAIIHRTVRWCTGLSGEPTAASATVGRQIRGRRVARSNGQQGGTGLSGVPTATKLQRSAAPGMEGNRAPDSPVRHPTEGNFGLPRMPPMAPSCLGAIKGTPRRMEEQTQAFIDHS
jgi:hypothetical protein